MPLDTLTKVYACGQRLNSAMVMKALLEAGRDGEKPTYARVHEAQRVSWVNYGIECNIVLMDPKELPDLSALPQTKLTLGGLPLVVDSKLWPSTVVFHNAEGKAVARIQGLAIPVGFDEAPNWTNCYSQAEIDKRIADEGWLSE
jgi:hypothetical protein